MLTTNKAVYGTDGSLSELGNIKGSGSGRKLRCITSRHINEPLKNHSYGFILDDDLSFDDEEFEDRAFLITARFYLNTEWYHVNVIYPPDKYPYGSNFIPAGSFEKYNFTFVCDGTNLDFNAYCNPEEADYIEELFVNVYVI